jgi:hypothetical protein
MVLASNVRATTSTTIGPSVTTIPARNPIAPHGSSSAWGGVASAAILLLILAAAAAMVWLFLSYRHHLREHRLQDEPGA